MGVPVRVLVDVATFPVYTIGEFRLSAGTLPWALRHPLLFDTAFGTMGGLFQVIFTVCKRVGYKITFDNPGEL